MQHAERVVVIGSGCVAQAMCEWVSETTGYTLCQVFARNRDMGSDVATKFGCDFESDFRKIARADIYIIAVSDSAIHEVSEAFDFGDAVVVHTSGSVDIDSISAKNRGVLYPLQTFTLGQKLKFREIPLCIEASNEPTLEIIERLAEKMSDGVIRCNSELRRNLHIAAVFTCNFVNHLYCIGESVMQQNGLDFALLKPLIAETTRKVLENKSPCPLQTGPASRKDYSTIEKHLDMLKEDTELANIYKSLTDSIINRNNG